MSDLPPVSMGEARSDGRSQRLRRGSRRFVRAGRGPRNELSSTATPADLPDSPSECRSAKKKTVQGNPNSDRLERANLSADAHAAVSPTHVALYTVFYNFCRIRVTPAMEADHVWSGYCEYMKLRRGKSEDRGRQPAISELRPQDFLFVAQPILSKPKSLT